MIHIITSGSREKQEAEPSTSIYNKDNNVAGNQPAQPAINITGAVLALCSLAVFSLTFDDLENEWKHDLISLQHLLSSTHIDLWSTLLFVIFVALSVVLASISATRKWSHAADESRILSDSNKSYHSSINGADAV